MSNIKISEFEENEKQKKMYEAYKKESQPDFEQLSKVRNMLSNDVWCDVTITATSFDSDCHTCGNWFAYSKGRQRDKIESTITDNPEGMNKATKELLEVLEKTLKDKIKFLANLYGFEEDNL